MLVGEPSGTGDKPAHSRTLRAICRLTKRRRPVGNKIYRFGRQKMA